jgi:hypothetical protein
MVSRHNRAMAFAILGSLCRSTSGWTPAGRPAAHFAVAGNSWFSGCSRRLFLSSEGFNGVLWYEYRVRNFGIMDPRDKTPKSEKQVRAGAARPK